MEPDEKLLEAARERLEWLREEYGEDDIDYQTFAPIVSALDACHILIGKALRSPTGQV